MAKTSVAFSPTIRRNTMPETAGLFLLNRKACLHLWFPGEGGHVWLMGERFGWRKRVNRVLTF